MKKVTTSVSMEELSPVIESVVSSGSDAVLCITGNSMLPLWRDRHNSVLLTACDVDKLKVGDIPLYRRENGQYVLHRIIKVNEDSFDLLGDAQWIVEKELPKKSVIAVAKGYYTEKGKYISCDSKKHKRYFAVWSFLLPIRRWILAIYRRTILKIKILNDRNRKNEG